MIRQCLKCGGLFATENLESFAGTPCRCGNLREDNGRQGPVGFVLASEMTVQQLQEHISYFQAALQLKVCGDPSKAVSWPTQSDKGE